MSGHFYLHNDLIDVYGPLIGVEGIAIYFGLATYANQGERQFPSEEALAATLGMRQRQVARALERLEAHGLIDRQAEDWIQALTLFVPGDQPPPPVLPCSPPTR